MTNKNKGRNISNRFSTLIYELSKDLTPIPPTPTKIDIQEKIRIFGDLNHCVYCGDNNPRQQDHFYPLVYKKRPTGYCNDIWNMVPSCGQCNQSKGGCMWYDWLNKKKLTKSHPRKRVGDNKVEELMKALHFFDKIGETKRQKWDPNSIRNKEQIDNLVSKIKNYCDIIQEEVNVLKTNIVL